MTLTLELSSEVEEVVIVEAARLGIEPVDFAANAMLFSIAALDTIVQRRGRLTRLQEILEDDEDEDDIVLALFQLLVSFHDTDKTNSVFQSKFNKTSLNEQEIKDRLHAIHEFTTAAHKKATHHMSSNTPKITTR